MLKTTRRHFTHGQTVLNYQTKAYKREIKSLAKKKKKKKYLHTKEKGLRATRTHGDFSPQITVKTLQYYF